MRFVLMLHSHIPWVLHHGTWPHGSDWLCEAVFGSYLPLLEFLGGAESEGTPTPLTVGITPVLAEQLADPAFRPLMERFLGDRVRHAAAAGGVWGAEGEETLAGGAAWWEDRASRMQALWEEIDGDVPGALRSFAERGRIELAGGPATHPFLPLLGREESVRLQLAVGQASHTRIFGMPATTGWLPECAWRAGGWWDPLPGVARPQTRPGLEEPLLEAGFRAVFVDGHQVDGAHAVPAGYPPAPIPTRIAPAASTHQIWGVLGAGGPSALSVLVRDARTALQVWSRREGYPGDARYLEFHRQHWPSGLRLWRVSGDGVPLGSKEPWSPEEAHEAARGHADHFVSVLQEISRDRGGRGAVVAPFDTELFGHWWFEGPLFLESLFRRLRDAPEPAPARAGEVLGEVGPAPATPVRSGSWGRDGDFSMWMNEDTRALWTRLWGLEERFWAAVPRALSQPRLHPALEQTARELLVAQSSDWPFILSTGVAGDYATVRFREHARNVENLLTGIRAALEGDEWPDEDLLRTAEALRSRTHPFPSLLGAIREAIR